MGRLRGKYQAVEHKDDAVIVSMASTSFVGNRAILAIGRYVVSISLLAILTACGPTTETTTTELPSPTAANTPTETAAPEPTSTSPIPTSTLIAPTRAAVVTAARPLKTPTERPVEIEKPATVSAPSRQTVTEAKSDIVIVEMSCTSQPEWVSIVNDVIAPQEMTGWLLHDEGGRSTFNFPDGYILRGKSAARIWSYGQGPAAPDNLHWADSPVWDDEEPDTAYLYNSAGELVSQMSCRQ